MSENRKRKFDIDEPTPTRMVTTLDIIDDYPILSKQIQAGCGFRNLQVQGHIMKTLHAKGSVFDLLMNILRSSVSRYFTNELELTVVPNETFLLFNISDKGSSSYIEWYELKKKQGFYEKIKDLRYQQPKIYTPEDYAEFFKRGESIPIDTYITESNNLNNQIGEWENNNPMPETESVLFSQIEIYNGEIKRFLNSYQNILNSMGIDFYFEESSEYDGICFLISDKPLPKKEPLQYDNQEFDLSTTHNQPEIYDFNINYSALNYQHH